ARSRSRSRSTRSGTRSTRRLPEGRSSRKPSTTPSRYRKETKSRSGTHFALRSFRSDVVSRFGRPVGVVGSALQEGPGCRRLARLAGETELLEDGVVPFQAAGALGSFATLLGLALLVVDDRSLTLGAIGANADAPRLGPVAALLLVGIAFKTYGLLSEGWNVR